MLSIKDLSRVYDVNIRSGKASLIPRGGPAQIAAINTVPPQPEAQPMPAFNLTSEQLQTGVMLITILLVLSVLG